MSLDLNRVPMPEQDPLVRARNFAEVPLGYSPEQARAEAGRCLQCKKPGCMAGCPVGIDIPAFLKLAAEGRFTDAARKIKEASSLPAVCGRVCPSVKASAFSTKRARRSPWAILRPSVPTGSAAMRGVPSP